MTAAELAEHLASRGTYSYSRSSGPGGQRRDKVETRVELTIERDAVEGLPARLAERTLEVLGLEHGPLRLTAESDRSRERNRVAVREQLARRVEPALRPPPPPRKATRPSRAARRRRVEAKQRRGFTKRLRKRPDSDS